GNGRWRPCPRARERHKQARARAPLPRTFENRRTRALRAQYVEPTLVAEGAMRDRWGRAAARSLGGPPLATVIAIVWVSMSARAGAGEVSPVPGSASSAASVTAPSAGDAVQDEAREDAAVEALRREVARSPNDADANYRLGLALRRAHRRPESVPYFE